MRGIHRVHNECHTPLITDIRFSTPSQDTKEQYVKSSLLGAEQQPKERDRERHETKEWRVHTKDRIKAVG